MIIDEEKSQLAARAYRAAQTATENILLNDRTRRSAAFQEIFVRIKHCIAEELISVAVKLERAWFQDRIDVAAAIASLAGVVERSLNFELLYHVGIGQRRVGEFRDVVVGDADAFDEVIIVVFALPVDLDADVASPEL